MTASVEDLDRAEEALARTSNRRYTSQRLDLPAALQEIQDWLHDDHQASTAFAGHWASLLGDVLVAIEDCGPLVTETLVSAQTRMVPELRACRSALRSAQRPPDASLRRRIERTVAYLAGKQGEPTLLVAAFRDLLAAQSATETDNAARLVVAFLEVGGHDPHALLSHVRSVLRDDAYAVASERHEPPPEDRLARAGASIEERLAIAEAALVRPATKSTVVVWQRFVNADLRAPMLLAIGSSVCLFNEQWLESALANGSDELAAVAPETTTDADLGLRRFASRASGSSETGSERTPSVYVRVSTLDATWSHALSVARLTADAISGVACLYGTPPRLWQLDESYICLNESGSRSSSISAPPSQVLSVDDSVALANDHTAHELARLAEKLGPRLPVRDPAITQAATLLSWLRTARLTDGPPRLLLCERVIERVAGWAGFDQPKRFVSEYLKLSWTIGRMRSEIAAAAFDAKFELRHRDPGSALLDAFSTEGPSSDGGVNLKVFLERFGEIAEEVGDHSESSPRLARLGSRLQPAGEPRRWLKELLEQFDQLEDRRRRVRNSLVHGGPVSDKTVGTVVDFGEVLAVHALGASIDGRLAGEDLIDHFLEERADLETACDYIRDGKPLSEALFWASEKGP